MHERLIEPAPAERRVFPDPTERRPPARAVQFRLTVGRANDPAEREADAVAAEVLARLRDGTGRAQGTTAPPGPTRVRRSTTSAGHDAGETVVAEHDEHALRSAGGSGSHLAGSVVDRMGVAFGADFSPVRLHTGPDVDIAAEGLQARAFTVGRDVYIRRSEYRPGTAAGDELIAHELTHTLQQGATRVRRSPLADPITIRHHVRGRHLSAKKEKMHLDFIRMKRMDPQFSKIIGKMIGVDLGGEEQSGGTFGHWWTEVGELDPITKEFDYDKSYGWWPTDLEGSLVNTVVGVDGELNAGDQQDPHAGETAPTEFHPVMEVDTAKEDYDAIRQRVTQKLDTVAHAYRGKWHWRLGWGKNCHTFQQTLKTKTGLHYQKSKKWLYDPAMQAVAQEREEARVADQERRDAAMALVTDWVDIPNKQVSNVHPVTMVESTLDTGQRIGLTGRTQPDQMGWDCVEYVTGNGQVGWMLQMEYEVFTGQRKI